MCNLTDLRSELRKNLLNYVSDFLFMSKDYERNPDSLVEPKTKSVLAKFLGCRNK